MMDVAKLAGVSHQTVSRVLNDPDAVRPATREAVLAAMQRLKYQRNMAARALASQRTHLLGVITAGEARFGPTNALHAVAEAARKAGYIASSMPATSVSETVEATGHLFNAGVDGIVAIAPTRTETNRITSARRQTPVVLIAADAPTSEGVSVVAVDQREGARQAVRHLASLGHRRIHHISGPREWFDAETRVIGWKEECAALGLEPGELVETTWDADGGYNAATELLAREPHPTAIFAANDLLALGAMQALRRAGLSVPDHVSMVGFDDTEGADFYMPPLTTVRQPFADVGTLAISVLLEMIAGAPERFQCIPPTLIERESTAPLS